MHFQYLVEDISGENLIRVLMNKFVQSYPNVTYDCKSFHGIGGFTKKNTVKETKTGKLLNDLATYLRGFNKSLQNFPSVIVVVLDNDDHDPDAFRKELEQVAQQNMITTDHIFCIAVEEVEAWLLGDEAAILAAYPHAKTQPLHSYVQDSICGTWEVLADVLFHVLIGQTMVCLGGGLHTPGDNNLLHAGEVAANILQEGVFLCAMVVDALE